jgi:hypothetical protein
MQIISVLQLDNLACFYQRLSGYSTASLADKDTLSLVGRVDVPAMYPCLTGMMPSAQFKHALAQRVLHVGNAWQRLRTRQTRFI